MGSSGLLRLLRVIGIIGACSHSSSGKVCLHLNHLLTLANELSFHSRDAPKPHWRQDFVVGVHPEDCDIIIVGGFAGEGFKFGPAIGEMAACLVTGSPFTVPEAYQRFRLDRKTLI